MTTNYVIKNKIKPGSIIVTDCCLAFLDLADKDGDHGMEEYRYEHKKVNHSGQIDKENAVVSYGRFCLVFDARPKQRNPRKEGECQSIKCYFSKTQRMRKGKTQPMKLRAHLEDTNNGGRLENS